MASLVCVLGVVAVVVFEGVLRDGEILLASVLAEATFASQTVIAVSESHPVLGFTTGDGWYVVQIPFVAGSALFVAVVAGAAAIITPLTLILPTRTRAGAGAGAGARTGAGVRARVWVVPVGVLVGVVVIVLANQVRLLVELAVVQATSQPGLHTLDSVWGTTALTITTTAVIAALLFPLVIRPWARRRA